MLIDTAFEAQATAVRDDLLAAGITITAVVFSHFHPDHISGLPMLNSPQIYGSGHYQTSLDQYTAKDKHSLFSGIKVVDDQSKLQFGRFELGFKPIQGRLFVAY